MTKIKPGKNESGKNILPAKIFLSTLWRLNLLQSTSLTELQKALEAQSCKSWVTNFSNISHTLGIHVLTANITCTYCIILLECANESPESMRIV